MASDRSGQDCDSSISDEIHCHDESDSSSCEDQSEPLKDSRRDGDAQVDYIKWSGKWELFGNTMLKRKMVKSAFLTNASAISDIIVNRGSLRRLDFQKADFDEVAISTYQSILLACPSGWGTQTKMTRLEFDSEFGDLHRSSLWRSVCDKMHGGTGDPLSKSNYFLRVMEAISSMRA